VDAVREVYLKTLLPFSAVNHFIDTSRAEVLARVAVLLDATTDADIEVENFQVSGLVFVVMSA
jgi:hypothetical protein